MTVAISSPVSLVWRLALTGLLLVIITALAVVALSAGADLNLPVATSAGDPAR